MMVSLLDFVETQSKGAAQDAAGKAGAFGKVIEGFLSSQDSEGDGQAAMASGQNKAGQGNNDSAISSLSGESGDVSVEDVAAEAVIASAAVLLPVNVSTPIKFDIGMGLGDDLSAEVADDASTVKAGETTASVKSESVWQGMGLKPGASAFMRFAEIPQDAQKNSLPAGEQPVGSESASDAAKANGGSKLPVATLPSGDIQPAQQEGRNSKTGQDAVSIGNKSQIASLVQGSSEAQVVAAKAVATESPAVERGLLIPSNSDVEVNNKMKMTETELGSEAMPAGTQRLNTKNAEVQSQAVRSESKGDAVSGLVIKSTGAEIKYELLTQEVAEVPNVKVAEVEAVVSEIAPAKTDASRSGKNAQSETDTGRDANSQAKTDKQGYSETALKLDDLSAADDFEVIKSGLKADEGDKSGSALSLGDLKIASTQAGKPLSMASAQSVNTQTKYVEQIQTLREFVDRFGQHLAKVVSSGDSSMVVDLNPPNLGRIVLTCQEDARGLTMQLTSNNSDVRAFLSGQENAIKEAVQNSGYKMAGFDVRANGNQSDRRRQSARSSEELEEKERKLVRGVSRSAEGVGSLVEAVDNKNGNFYMVA